MLAEQIFPISLAALYLTILIVTAEFFSRWQKMDSELTRKIVHIGTGNIILLAWWFNISQSIFILASIIASFMAIISYFLPILPSINSVGRKSLGTLFYAISIGILISLFWQNSLKLYAVIGILVMSYGDGMAGLIGQKWGKHPYQIFGSNKSWEGSFTMTIVSFIIALTVFSLADDWQWQNLIVAGIMAVFAAFIETFSPIGVDNLTVPMGSAIICYYGQQLLI
jgi:phytol kinase